MAIAKKFYIRSRRNGQWEIQVRKNGSTVAACPRERYKHLDGQPRHNVEFWITQNLDHPEPQPRTDASLSRLVDEFAKFYTNDRKKSEGTVAEHKRHLMQNVIPYFLTLDPPLRDPNYWPQASIKMNMVLKKWGLTDNQIFRSVVALRKFYKWLQEQNEVLPQNVLLTRTPAKDKVEEKTKLKHTIDPEVALDLARNAEDPDYAKFVLLGYFFSLRPQEIFGVKVGDFRLGEEARFLECSKTMSSIKILSTDTKLYGGLVVNISRQRTKSKKETSPKRNSTGWVACIDREAARLLVELIGKDQKPGNFLLNKVPNQFYKDWPFDSDPFDFEPKDLRRASLYWLGHNTDITIVQMMKHARQKQEKSLQLYLRRPEEKLETWASLRVEDI